ncbi:MAG: response regulator transcription factor [Deltaproteobacteria bacterium]|nr:response regulator transcription factor [Deltaproteobacteria bacterium]
MRILVVEDEKKVASFIKKGLEEESYAVDVSYEGEEGCYLAETNPYDLIILDLMLPKKNGLSILKELRDKGINTPILLLTAKGSVEDRVAGLNAGADDYLAKPFVFAELLARVRSLLRRGGEKSPVLKFADLTMDPVTRRVTRGVVDIELTSKEYALLEYFMRRPNQVLTRTMISEHVWESDFDTFTNVIDVYVNYLRNKIDKGNEKKLIHTIRGVGYILKEQND